MKAIKSNYAYVLKSIKKDKTLKPVTDNLKGKTYIISGATRGIGYNIAYKLAELGANLSIIGKTTEKHPKLEGTIYSAAKEIRDSTNNSNCTAMVCDIRDQKQVDRAIDQTIYSYGNIDGVVLNASALCLNNTMKQSEKEIELMLSLIHI